MIPGYKEKSIAENKIRNNLHNKMDISIPKKSSDVHHLAAGDIAALFQTSIENGLSDKEINERHTAFGYNRLTAKKEKTVIQVLLQQFTGVAVYLLLAAAFISFILNDIAEAIAIVIVV